MNYTKAFENEIRDWALARIPEKRHRHVHGVVESSDALAVQYIPEKTQQARIAGWLHDAAKHLADDELIAVAESRGHQLSDGEKLVPMLLHGVVGYLLGAEALGFGDNDIKTACAYHTTGHPNMNTLDKVVLIADLIEPSRDFPGVDDLRQSAESSLDKALLLSLDFTIQHLLKKGRIIDPNAILLRNQLLADSQSE